MDGSGGALKDPSDICAQLNQLMSSFTQQTGQQLHPNQFSHGSGNSSQLDQLFDFVGKQASSPHTALSPHSKQFHQVSSQRRLHGCQPQTASAKNTNLYAFDNKVHM